MLKWWKYQNLAKFSWTCLQADTAMVFNAKCAISCGFPAGFKVSCRTLACSTKQANNVCFQFISYQGVILGDICEVGFCVLLPFHKTFFYYYYFFFFLIAANASHHRRQRRTEEKVLGTNGRGAADVCKFFWLDKPSVAWARLYVCPDPRNTLSEASLSLRIIITVMFLLRDRYFAWICSRSQGLGFETRKGFRFKFAVSLILPPFYTRFWRPWPVKFSRNEEV